MTTTGYSDILDRARRLSPADQLRLLEDLAALVRREMDQQPRRSILELQGLGKEIWADVDVEQYIDQERATWDG